MKIAIVDTEDTGHHFEYIYGVCRQVCAAHEHDMVVDLYCNKKIEEYIERNNLSSLDKVDGLTVITNRISDIHSGKRLQKRMAYDTIKKLADYDQIILLHINLYLLALSFYGFFKKHALAIKGIYFNPFIRRKDSFGNKLRALNLRYLCRRFDEVAIYILNDQQVAGQLNSRCSTQAFDAIPDPIPTFYYNSSPPKKRRPSDKPYTYAMLGTLSRRKGLFEFLQAIEQSGSHQHFLLAGKVINDITAKVKNKVDSLKNKGVNIELENSFLSNRYFAELVDTSDIIVLPYLTKGASSGILGHAAYRNKSVIGPGNGILSDIIHEFGLGTTINPRDVPLFAKSLTHPQQIIEASSIAGMKKYVKHNSYRCFYKKLLS